MGAIISYRPNTQKEVDGFKSVLNSYILRDICFRITGQEDYIIVEKMDTYNKGRLLTVEYNDSIHYVTLSEVRIEGRNSSLQSVPTAINIFYLESNPNKYLWYYFLPYEGNPFTDYHLLYYKLMATADIRFLNIESYYNGDVRPYSNVEEIIAERENNSKNNRSNNSSFISKTSDKVQLYAKTYGANKYESTIFGVALSKIADRPIDIFAVSEQNLKQMPLSSLETFKRLGNINVYTTVLRLNKLMPDTMETLRLRSAAYNFNLLSRIGMKRCALCGCEIPEIIHGAHVWGVAEIRNCNKIDDAQRYIHAVSGHNGLWLCHNHHKLFDSNLLVLNFDGKCLIKRDIPLSYQKFINSSLMHNHLNRTIMSDDFIYYLTQRNLNIDLSCYIEA